MRLHVCLSFHTRSEYSFYPPQQWEVNDHLLYFHQTLHIKPSHTIGRPTAVIVAGVCWERFTTAWLGVGVCGLLLWACCAFWHSCQCRWSVPITVDCSHTVVVVVWFGLLWIGLDWILSHWSTALCV
jgi:hypothetical protein